ncbi:MAG: hypothetical protein RMM58_15700 [Chloroflexota bacterium]|nr:hypothetical protein [Dehalococcoidia bacterium]MDW8255316.1 hypothetical protein [Chloroflexota bacterium]
MVLRLGAVAALLVAVAAVAFGTTAGSPAYAQQMAEDFPIPGGHFYTQTRGAYPPGYGFAVVDDGIQFFTTLRQLGGPAAAGYPISQRFLIGGRPAQAFQRVILVWDPAAGQASVLQTGPNLHLIPSEALVPAPWRGLQPGPFGQTPSFLPGFAQPPAAGQPPLQALPFGLPIGQPFGDAPTPPSWWYPFWFWFPFYAPYAPGVPVCDPALFPLGCPPLPFTPPPPPPTPTPVPGPPACSAENTEIYFDPPRPAVGQRTLIRVTSAYGWEYVGLTGPWNPRYEGLSPGGLNWVWTWSVTPLSPGFFQYTFTINDGTGCVTGDFSIPATPPPTPTPTSASAAQQRQPAQSTATPTQPPATATPTSPPPTATPTQAPPTPTPTSPPPTATPTSVPPTATPTAPPTPTATPST